MGKIKKDALPNGNIKTILRGSKANSSSFANSIAPIPENINSEFSSSNTETEEISDSKEQNSLSNPSEDIPIKLSVKFYSNFTPKLHVVVNNKNRTTFVKEARIQKSENEATENDPAEVSILGFLQFVKGNAEFPSLRLGPGSALTCHRHVRADPSNPS